MPQDRLQQALMNRPVAVKGDVQYPKDGDPGVKNDYLARGLMTSLGLEDQKPGDAAGAVGSLAGMFLGPKLLKFFPKGAKAGLPTNVGDMLLREHVTMPHEFHQMPTSNPLHDLGPGEIEKIMDLSRPRPTLEHKK